MSVFKISFNILTMVSAISYLLVILRCVECMEKTSHDDTKNPRRQIPRKWTSQGTTQEESESEEEFYNPSLPEMIGIRGMASAGLSSLSAAKSGTVPQCLGHDMRMEKLIQVTRHCESETEEGQSDSESPIRSLCFTACMMKYLGLIGEDLMFTSNIDSVVIDIFPPAAQVQAKRAFRSCAKQTVLPLSNADNCTSFGPVKGCIFRAVQTVCSEE